FSPSLKASVDRRLGTENFDVIFIYCSAMAPYASSVTAVPKVIDFIDVDSQKWLDYARTAALPMKAVYWREGVLLRRYERRIAGECAHAFVASEREAALLRSIAPSIAVTPIPNGVSPSARPALKSSSRKLIFTGVMDYKPNVDAVIHFVGDIWPIVRQA